MPLSHFRRPGQPVARREFITALGAVIATPALVRAASVLPPSPDSVDALIDSILDEAVDQKAEFIFLHTVASADPILKVRFKTDTGMVVRPRPVSLERQNALFGELRELLTMRERAAANGIDYHDDGIQMFHTAGSGAVRFRLQVSEAADGPLAVLHLISNAPLATELDGLGLSRRDLSVLVRALYRDKGLFLVAGLPGSYDGRITTALYASCSHHNGMTEDVCDFPRATNFLLQAVEANLHVFTTVEANSAAEVPIQARTLFAGLDARGLVPAFVIVGHHQVTLADTGESMMLFEVIESNGAVRAAIRSGHYRDEFPVLLAAQGGRSIDAQVAELIAQGRLNQAAA